MRAAGRDQRSGRQVGGARWAVAYAVGDQPRVRTAANRPVAISELSDETFDVLGEVTLSNQRHGLHTAFSHDARYMYLVARSAQSAGADLVEMDMRSPGKVARSLHLPDGRFQGIAVHCPSRKIFVSDPANGTIWVVNRNHFAIEWQIRVVAPGAMAMSPEGDVLYVLSADGRSMWAIDPNSNAVVGHLADLEWETSRGVVLSDRSRLFVSQECKDGGVSVTRVLPRTPDRARVVFMVDRHGNCRISRAVLADRLVA